MWNHRKVADAAALEKVPPGVSPDQAQAWCNFVLWTPDRVVDDCELRVGTLRKEAPPGRAEGHIEARTPWSGNNLVSYRFEVVGQHRRLRVKEFLYDWAFPALDQPCLWKSRTRAVPLDERYVLWFGVDYLGHQAAAARIARTTVELSVLEGEFTDQEILDLYRALRPADPVGASAIADTSFAALSYWARRKDAVNLVVPVGLWKFRRGEHASQWETGDAAAALVGEWGLPSSLGDLWLDSAARMEDGMGRLEIEAVYVGGPDRGAELRLIAQRPGGGNLRVPADEEPHPGERASLRVHDVDVQLGWIDERYGPFQAVAADHAGGLEFTLLSGTGVGLDRTWFLAAVRELLDRGGR